MTLHFRVKTAVDGGTRVDGAAELNRGAARARGAAAPLHASYSAAREHLDELLRQVGENGEAVVIHRPGHNDVALVTMDELAGLLESARLNKPRAKVRRPLGALHEAHR